MIPRLLGLRLPLPNLFGLVAAMLLLQSCTQNDLNQRNFEKMIDLATASYAYPAMDYGDLFEPSLSRLMAEGDYQLQLRDYESALQQFLDTEDYIISRVGAASLLLLPVLDRIVLTDTALGRWHEADRAQHRYHAIITRKFADDQRVLNRADYRMGCWHFITGDWYQAQFDFEDVIRRLESSRSNTVDDNKLLKDSRAFEETVAFNCRPLAPLP